MVITAVCRPATPSASASIPSPRNCATTRVPGAGSSVCSLKGSGSPAATRRVPDRATNRWHDRSGSSRTIGSVFLPGVANLQLGATRKRLAWPSAMETATPSDLPFAAADTASGERWISLRELAEARGVSQHSTTQLVRRNGWRRQKDNRGHGPGRPGGPGGVGGPPWSAGWSRRWGVGGASRPAQRPAGEGQGFASSQRPGGVFGDMSHSRQAGQFGQRGVQSRSFALQRSLGGGGRGVGFSDGGGRGGGQR